MSNRIVLFGFGTAAALLLYACFAGQPTCKDYGYCYDPGPLTGGAAGAAGESGSSGQGGSGTEPCNGECGGETPVCKTETGVCVECLSDEPCEGDTPVCHPTTNTCVGCGGDEHCSGETARCDLDTSTCAECTDGAHCTDPAEARCEAGTCTACQTNADCAHVEDRGVCDAGACVQCTPDDAAACGESACNPVTKQCSAFGSNRQTCDACDTDANCANPNEHCVPMLYEGVARPGGYCLKTNADGCEVPFSVRITGRTTLSGMAGLAFCGINEALTTCEAVLALQGDQRCSGGTDAECPPGGSCRQVGDLANRCTYACAVASDCPSSGASSNCGGGSPPNEPHYCGGRAD